MSPAKNPTSSHQSSGSAASIATTKIAPNASVAAAATAGTVHSGAFIGSVMLGGGVRSVR